MGRRDCWLLGVTRGQWEETWPGTVCMGWPLIGDLNRFRGGPEADECNNRALVQQFGLVYPVELAAIKGRWPGSWVADPSFVVDPRGLWSFFCKAALGDLVLVHTQKKEAREALAIVRITGRYIFHSGSAWPHVLPAVCLNRDSWALPPEYRGWGDYFSSERAASGLVAMIRERIRLRPAEAAEPC